MIMNTNEVKPFSIISLLTISFIILQSSSCNSVKELDYIGIRSTEIKSLTLNKFSIKINLEYYNPNRFRINVKETNLKIYLNDKFLATADQPGKTQIPKLSKFVFPVIARFDPFEILGSAIFSVFEKTTKISIKGTAKVGREGFYVKLPIRITESVSILSN